MCTGRVDPVFLVDGFINGADGVFMGGCHLGECNYRDGNYEAINRFNLVQQILKDLKVNPERLSLHWISAAESVRFVKLTTELTNRIRELGPLGSSENLDVDDLKIKLKAAKLALEGKRLRMVVARQAKYKKYEGGYRDIPADHKLHGELDKALADEMATKSMLLYLQDKPRPVDELAGLLNVSADDVVAHFKKLEKKKLVESDRLIT